VGKQPQRHQGEGGELPFYQDESKDEKEAEDKKTDHGRTAPGVCNTPEFKADEEEDYSGDYAEGSWVLLARLA
jgi:hypothetical protein